MLALAERRDRARERTGGGVKEVAERVRLPPRVAPPVASCRRIEERRVKEGRGLSVARGELGRRWRGLIG